VKKFALDTNLYVSAFRNTDAAEELSRFYASYAPAVYLNSVVLHELLVGTSSPAKAREIHGGIVEPFRRTRRVITPSAEAWAIAAEAIAAMARRDNRELRTLPKSLVNDFLIAASCREAGVTLVTQNIEDFESISRFIKVQFIGPWTD
jgi:predicted nucleic acid-binding protein